MTPPAQVPVFEAPLHTSRLTPAQWTKIETALEDWKREVLAAARKHPARSYRLGVAQVEAFGDLVGGLQGAAPASAMFGGVSASMRASEAWARTYTLHELDDALNVYVGKIKDALLYGLRGALNPTQIASMLYKATGDAQVNWRTIARTEMARANAVGRLDACAAAGYDRVWVPPHIGSCGSCKRLLEGNVFTISELREASNYGRPESEWMPCCPLHPHCRHSYLPYIEEVYAEAMRGYAALEDAGLADEDTLDAMFDSSGQLRPEYADVDFSAAKTMDPHAELLAAVVHKLRTPRAARLGRERLQRLMPDELRTDVYQRAMDPEKVWDMVHAMRRGETLAAPKVSKRDDGTHWIIDGQHRVAAHKLERGRDTPISCHVRDGMAWGEEADHCRAAIAKVWNAWSGGLDVDVAKGPSPEEALLAAVSQVASNEWADSEHPPLVFPPPSPLIFEGLRLRDDVAMAVEAWWSRIAGPAWRGFSAVYVPAHGGRVDVRVDYPALRVARPELAKLSDTDLHFALVAATRQAGGEVKELAPGLPMDLRILAADQDLDSHDWHGQTGPSWQLGAQAWRGGIPTGPMAVAKVAWSYEVEPRDVAAGALLDSDQYEAVAKAAKEQAANSGVEHWITIHPHGDQEKGQPVLVRNNADGTMSVIGGAGGNLNYLRLDPSRRVDRDEKTGRSKGASGGQVADQAVSADEAEKAAAEREAEVAAARDALAQTKATQDQHKAALHQYVKDELGIDLEHPDVTGAQRRKMLTKLRTSALRTLAYGAVASKDTNDGASRDELGLPKPKPAPATDDEDGKEARPPRPQVALQESQAADLLDYFGDLAAIGKVAGSHRRVIAGEGKASDANPIDWSAGGQAAKDDRRAKATEALVRSDVARSLLQHADGQVGENGKTKSDYLNHVARGGFDTVDAFSHSILGQRQLSYEASKLLGVAGSAQLVAHAILRESDAGGKQGLDREKVVDALNSLTDATEKKVAEDGLKRIRTAAEKSAAATKEITASERGESLYTTTMARSVASAKIIEAKRGLGSMIGGMEACSALKVALDRRPGEKIKVGGFPSPAKIKDLASKAGVKVRDGDIVRNGAANYTLQIEPERLEGLLRPPKPVDQALRDKLEGIRTGKDLDAAIADAQMGPLMTHPLDRNQAKGTLFLGAAGSGLLAFDPGVGKTHTAIAAALRLMHEEPDKGHKAVIVAPTNMLRSWADTLAKQVNSGKTVQVIGQSDTDPTKEGGNKAKQLARDADFTIVSYETHRSMRDQFDGRHNIVIADELQKAKTPGAELTKALHATIGKAREQHGDDTHFYGLTGTPIEKGPGDLHTMLQMVSTAKGKELGDRKSFGTENGKGLGADAHIARGDKVRAFRKGLDESMFRLSAQDAGNALPKAARAEHKVTLDDQHLADYQKRVVGLNDQQEGFLQQKKEGTAPINPKTGRPESPVKFGGRAALMDALYNRPDSQLGQAVVDEIQKTGTFEHKGGQYKLADGSPDPSDHAGSYEHKHVVFGANGTSKALFGADWAKGKKGGLHAQLEASGTKVFTGHGKMTSAENEKNYKAFLAHKGKAVFLTNDKNNAGISLQFGQSNGDRFQHGATHMHHFTLPENNATIQQREARILRKGTEGPVQYHNYDAGTPIEAKLRDMLATELRTQDLAANSNTQVAGSDTLAHHLGERGIKPEKRATETAK